MWNDLLLGACGLLTAFSAMGAGLLLRALKQVHWLDSPAAPSGKPARLSVVIPARNEETDLECALQSVLHQQDVEIEVFVINDHSTDRTGAIADALARSDPRVKVLHNPPLPPGWLGKQNAMQQAAALATADLLLFTDADIVHHPKCFATGVAEMQRGGYDFISLLPRFELYSFWESALVPALFFWLPIGVVIAGIVHRSALLFLAGAVTYASQYLMVRPGRRLYQYRPGKLLFFPLVVFPLFCCYARALYYRWWRGAVFWRGRAVKVNVV